MAQPELIIESSQKSSIIAPDIMPSVAIWMLQNVLPGANDIVDGCASELTGKISEVKNFLQILLDVDGKLKPVDQIPSTILDNLSKDIYRNFLPAHHNTEMKDGKAVDPETDADFLARCKPADSVLTDQEFLDLHKCEDCVFAKQRIYIYVKYLKSQKWNDLQIVMFLALSIQNVTGKAAPLRFVYDVPFDRIKAEIMTILCEQKSKNLAICKLFDNGIELGFNPVLQVPTVTYNVIYGQTDSSGDTTKNKIERVFATGQFELLFFPEGRTIIRNELKFIDTPPAAVHEAFIKYFHYDQDLKQYTFPLSPQVYAEMLGAGYILYSGSKNDKKFYEFVDRFKNGATPLDISMVRLFPDEWIAANGDPVACLIDVAADIAKSTAFETTGFLQETSQPNNELRIAFSGDKENAKAAVVVRLKKILDVTRAAKALPPEFRQQEPKILKLLSTAFKDLRDSYTLSRINDAEGVAALDLNKICSEVTRQYDDLWTNSAKPKTKVADDQRESVTVEAPGVKKLDLFSSPAQAITALQARRLSSQLCHNHNLYWGQVPYNFASYITDFEQLLSQKKLCIILPIAIVKAITQDISRSLHTSVPGLSPLPATVEVSDEQHRQYLNAFIFRLYDQGLTDYQIAFFLVTLPQTIANTQCLPYIFPDPMQRVITELRGSKDFVKQHRVLPMKFDETLKMHGLTVQFQYFNCNEGNKDFLCGLAAVAEMELLFGDGFIVIRGGGVLDPEPGSLAPKVKSLFDKMFYHDDVTGRYVMPVLPKHKAALFGAGFVLLSGTREANGKLDPEFVTHCGKVTASLAAFRRTAANLLIAANKEDFLIPQEKLNGLTLFEAACLIKPWRLDQFFLSPEQLTGLVHDKLTKLFSEQLVPKCLESQESRLQCVVLAELIATYEKPVIFAQVIYEAIKLENDEPNANIARVCSNSTIQSLAEARKVTTEIIKVIMVAIRKMQALLEGNDKQDMRQILQESLQSLHRGFMLAVMLKDFDYVAANDKWMSVINNAFRDVGDGQSNVVKEGVEAFIISTLNIPILAMTHDIFKSADEQFNQEPIFRKDKTKEKLRNDLALYEGRLARDNLKQGKEYLDKALGWLNKSDLSPPERKNAYLEVGYLNKQLTELTLSVELNFYKINASGDISEMPLMKIFCKQDHEDAAALKSAIEAAKSTLSAAMKAIEQYNSDESPRPQQAPADQIAIAQVLSENSEPIAGSPPVWDEGSDAIELVQIETDKSQQKAPATAPEISVEDVDQPHAEVAGEEADSVFPLSTI